MYPYIEYVKYLLAGSIAMAIFVVAMIGGGITFIDDKARGLHEGYLVTPINKPELVFGLIWRGRDQGADGGDGADDHRRTDCGHPATFGIRCGCFIWRWWWRRVIGDDQFHVSADGAGGRSAGAARDFRRAEYAAVFPFRRHLSRGGFPWWLRWISMVDPFTYTVHALRNLLLKNTGIEGIYGDVLVLSGFSLVIITASVALFKRQI